VIIFSASFPEEAATPLGHLACCCRPSPVLLLLLLLLLLLQGLASAHLAAALSDLHGPAGSWLLSRTPPLSEIFQAGLIAGSESAAAAAANTTGAVAAAAAAGGGQHDAAAAAALEKAAGSGINPTSAAAAAAAARAGSADVIRGGGAPGADRGPLLAAAAAAAAAMAMASAAAEGPVGPDPCAYFNGEDAAHPQQQQQHPQLLPAGMTEELCVPHLHRPRQLLQATAADMVPYLLATSAGADSVREVAGDLQLGGGPAAAAAAAAGAAPPPAPSALNHHHLHLQQQQQHAEEVGAMDDVAGPLAGTDALDLLLKAAEATG
jgi:hypothetical protein